LVEGELLGEAEVDGGVHGEVVDEQDLLAVHGRAAVAEAVDAAVDGVGEAGDVGDGVADVLRVVGGEDGRGEAEVGGPRELAGGGQAGG
jgi:hypothetical protein